MTKKFCFIYSPFAICLPTLVLSVHENSFERHSPGWIYGKSWEVVRVLSLGRRGCFLTSAACYASLAMVTLQTFIAQTYQLLSCCEPAIAKCMLFWLFVSCWSPDQYSEIKLLSSFGLCSQLNQSTVWYWDMIILYPFLLNMYSCKVGLEF